MLDCYSLKLGMVVRYKVRSDETLLVLENNNGTITFLDKDLNVFVEDTGCYDCISYSKKEIVTNLESGISHISFNNKVLCGSNSTQNTIVEGYEDQIITCEKCQIFFKHEEKEFIDFTKTGQEYLLSLIEGM